MRRLLTIIFVLVIVAIGGLLAAPNFIPADFYRGQIEAGAERSTGRSLTINGEIKIALFPRIQLELNDVTFANRQGQTPTEMASMDRLSIGLEILPLLRREIVVNRLVLEHPVIILEIDRSGRGNWEFDLETNPSTEEQVGGAGGEFALNELSLGDVRLVNGDVSFRDRRNGADYHVQDIDLTVSLPTLSGPLGLHGELTYNGERMTLDTEIASPRGFLDGVDTPIQLAIRSDVMTLSFNGSATVAQGGALPIRAGGAVELNVPSVRRFAAWTGSPIQSPGGFGALEVTGRANANGDILSFNDARLSFDEMQGTGNFGIDLGRSRPRITGSLNLNKVDVRPYVGEGSTTPRRRGNTSSQWSTEPIDFSALRAVDANLDIIADEIITSTLRMGRSTLHLTLRNGVMTAVIEEMNLYEGSGSARFEVDARNDTVVIRQQSTFSLIQALPLFSDLANFSSLDGIGNITLDVTTRGRSQRDFISGLNGSGEIQFTDGAIKGINIAHLVRTVGSQFTDIAIPRGPQQTDFAELGGTFDIRDGVINNVDMRLLNPLLRVTGAGNVNLVNRTIEYRVVPQAVMSLEGQGSTRDVTGAAVPLLISGSWDNLHYGPDLGAIGERLIEGLLGGGRTPAGSGSEEEGTSGEAEEPVDLGETLLRNLFGAPAQPAGEVTEPVEGASEASEEQPEEQPEEEEEEPPTPEDILRELFDPDGD